MKRGLLALAALALLTGCAPKKVRPQINLYLAPPPHVPFVDLHNPWTENTI